jgi:hypothetical protein
MIPFSVKPKHNRSWLNLGKDRISIKKDFGEERKI